MIIVWQALKSNLSLFWGDFCFLYIVKFGYVTFILSIKMKFCILSTCSVRTTYEKSYNFENIFLSFNPMFNLLGYSVHISHVHPSYSRSEITIQTTTMLHAFVDSKSMGTLHCGFDIYSVYPLRKLLKQSFNFNHNKVIL